MKPYDPGETPTVYIARLEAEVNRLRGVIQTYLDGDAGPDFKTKHDQCPHGKFGWEDCGCCTDAYFARGLNAAPPQS